MAIVIVHKSFIYFTKQNRLNGIKTTRQLVLIILTTYTWILRDFGQFNYLSFVKHEF